MSSIAELVREVAELRDEVQGQVLRDAVQPTAATTTGSTASGASNCHLVTALNNGPDCPAGGVRMIVDDQHAEDRTVRPGCGGASTITLVQSQFFLPDSAVDQTITIDSFASLEDDDLILAYSRSGFTHDPGGSNQTPLFPAYRAYDDAGDAIATAAQIGSDSTQLEGDLEYIWKDQLPGATLFRAGGNASQAAFVLVLRGVRRRNRVADFFDGSVDFEGANFFATEQSTDSPTDLSGTSQQVTHGPLAAAYCLSVVSTSAIAVLDPIAASELVLTNSGDELYRAVQARSAGGQDGLSVYGGDSSSPYTTTWESSLDSAGSGASRAVYVLTLAIEGGTPTTLDSSCNPLVVERHEPNTFLATNDNAGRSDARKRLRASRRRRPVIATKAIPSGESGGEKAWVYLGVVPTDVYIRDPNHQYADLGPTSAIRQRLYDSGELANVTGEVGVLGEHVRRNFALETGQDPRSLEFLWRNDQLVSAPTGRFRIVRRYDKPDQATTAITITLTSTGNDVVATDTPGNIYRVLGAAAGGGTTTFTIDLNEHYPGLKLPSYGDGVTWNQSLESDEAAVTGALQGVEGRRLRITYTRTWEQSGTSETPVTATFTIASTAALAADDPSRFATCHPMVYLDASWPESEQPLPEPRPAGSDIVIASEYPSAPDVAILENYDPWFGRVPGSVAEKRAEDNRVGRKRCLVEYAGEVPDVAESVVSCC